MSKPRYDWWPYVKGIIRRYPKLKEQHRELHSMSMVANYSGMPRGTSPSRNAESAAIRELPSVSQREYEAVYRAVAETERHGNGRDKLKVIKMVLWDQSHTLRGAALQIPCDYNTAQNWHERFIKLVAKYYGLMDQ